MRSGWAVACLVAVALAGCLGSDDGVTDGHPPLEDTRGREWSDEELIGQVNANFTNPLGLPEPHISIEPVPEWQRPGDVTFRGTVSRESAVFVTLTWGDTCTSGFQHSPRIIANGSWEYTYQDLAMGEYRQASAHAFGRDADGFLDLTVSSATTSDPVGSFYLGYDATVQVDYGDTSDQQPVDQPVRVWDRSADPYYGEEDEDGCPVNVERPDYLNVHDVLVAWELQHGHTIEYTYHEDFNSYSVDVIDGHGQGLAGAPPWWCYTVNGSSDGVQGISIQRFQPGDVIRWELGDCGFVTG